MNTFSEYQSIAAKIPLSLRNNSDRIAFPVTGLQQESGKLGSALAAAFESGKFRLTAERSGEVKDRLADILWFIALLCDETGISMESIAAHSLTQLQSRTQGLDPDER